MLQAPKVVFMHVAKEAEDYIVEFCNSKKIDFVILRFGTIFEKIQKLNNGVKK